MNKKLYRVSVGKTEETVEEYYMLVDNISDVEKAFYDIRIHSIEPVTLANVDWMLSKYNKYLQDLEN